MWSLSPSGFPKHKLLETVDASRCIPNSEELILKLAPKHPSFSADLGVLKGLLSRVPYFPGCVGMFLL